MEIEADFKVKLMSIAYRMLGSIQDAEDIVQETLLKWHQSKTDNIQNHEAWLTKVCTRKCLDSLKEARRKRESYPGVWLPEPVVSGQNNWSESADPEENSILAESMTMAFMLLLDSLSPEERATYILTEAFAFKSQELGEILGKSPEACRKLKERAKSKINPERNPSQVDHRQLQLLGELFQAAQSGNRQRILEVLAEDCAFYSDGGGKATAAVKVIDRADEIAAMFLGIAKFTEKSGAKFETHFCTVNHRPGMILIRTFPEPRQVETVFSVEIRKDKILSIFAMRNPDKLLRCSLK